MKHMHGFESLKTGGTTPPLHWDEMSACTWLAVRGIREVQNGVFEISRSQTLGVFEKSAIRYLLDEWDFDLKWVD